MKFVHYNPNIVASAENQGLPGIPLFQYYFKIYNSSVVPVDRTNTLKLPVKTHSLFPMPIYRKFDVPFQEICDRRAKELLQRAEEMAVTIYSFWSGGIDSTLALISLIKNASPEQMKNV